MPELQAAVAARPDSALVTVVISGRAGRIARVVQATGFTAPVLLDLPPGPGQPTLRQRYDIRSVPWTLTVDREGRARRVIVGGHDRAYFGQVLDRLDDGQTDDP